MISAVRRTLITLWFWLGVVIATALTGISYVILPLGWLWPSVSQHDRITFLIENIMTTFILSWMTLLGLWKVNHYHFKKSGSRPKDSNGPFLLAANHNSLIDTLFISDLAYKKTYTYNVKWSNVPVFGWLCIAADYIGIDTSSAEQKAKVVPKITAAIKNGYSVMVYPQGTRSRKPDSPIIPEDVKTGAFRVAVQGKCQILPIVIRGSNKIVSRYGIVDWGVVDIVYCDPIQDDDVDQLRNQWIDIVNSTIVRNL